jgi:predicted transposase YdaD
LKYIKINLYYIILLEDIERPNEFLNQLEKVPIIRGNIMGTLVRKFEENGIQKGKLEQAKSIALSMLQDGMCCSAIAKYTGLSKEEVKNLDSTHKCNH